MSVPGFLGDIATTDDAGAAISSEQIGFPVDDESLGRRGGGKGMRLAYHEKDVREGFEAPKRRRQSASATIACLSRSSSRNPRHIEIQVLGDQHGNILYLGERECSIQRRHQKVIEEAPSPFRRRPNCVRRWASRRSRSRRAVGYYNAGTVELSSGQDAELLLPRDEHAAAGRASGYRGSDGARPRRADDPRRGWGTAWNGSGPSTSQWLGDRNQGLMPKIPIAGSFQATGGSFAIARSTLVRAS